MSPEEKKLEKLQKLFEVVNEDYATPDDLIQLSEALIGVISETKKVIDREREEEKGEDKKEKTELRKLLEEKEQKLDTIISRLASDTTKALTQAESKTSKELKRLEKKIPNRTDLTGIYAEIAQIKRELTTVPTEITANPEAVRNALELLQGGERLDKSAIRGLDEALLTIEEKSKQRETNFGFVLRDVTAGTGVTIDKSDPNRPVISSTGTGGGHVIEDEGTPLTQRTNLNFVGAGVTVTDDAGNDATVVTILGGGGGSGTPGGSDTQVQFNDGGSFGGDAGLTYNKTSNELTAGSFSGGASALTSLNINGTNGNGHIHMKHQASDPTSQASSTTIFADANGNPAWINNGLSKITLDGDGVTAARSYTLPDASGTVALTSDLHAPVTVTDSAEIDFTLTGQDITASLKAGSIDESKLDASTNASLALANSASQPGHTHTSTDINDFNEAAQDAIGTILQNTDDATWTYDDVGDTISFTTPINHISNRTVKATLDGTEEVIVVDLSDNSFKKTTTQDIANLATGGSGVSEELAIAYAVSL